MGQCKTANYGINNGRYSHGMCNTRIYGIYKALKRRCTGVHTKSYKDYGARGIECEWKTFEEFYKDMKEGYSNELTIDRINVNGNYCKDNCKWSTMKEQANNTRRNHKIEYKGKMETLSYISEKEGINYQTLASRVNTYGITGDKLFKKKLTT